MGNRLEVAGFGGVCHGPAPGQAGFGGRGQFHGAHSMGSALLLGAQLALVLGQLPVQGYGLGSKQGQVLGAAVPGQAKKRRKQFQHRHFTCPHSRESNTKRLYLFHQIIETASKMTSWHLHLSSLRGSAIREKSTVGFWKQAQLYSSFCQGLLIINPGSHLRCHPCFLPVLKGWAYGPIVLSFSRELQSHYNCAWAQGNAFLMGQPCPSPQNCSPTISAPEPKEMHFDGRTTWNHQQQTQTRRQKQLCDSGSLAYRISHQITSNEACPAHSNWISSLPPTTTKVRSKAVFMVIIHPSERSLLGWHTPLCLFLPFLGSKLTKPSLSPV